jgi:hypothetical protein
MGLEKQNYNYIIFIFVVVNKGGKPRLLGDIGALAKYSYPLVESLSPTFEV